MMKLRITVALIFLALIILPYSTSAWEPSIVCTDTDTETTTGQTFIKNYFIYYDENVSQGRICVETYILFKNVNSNATTFFQVKGSDIFHSGSHLNNTGWYTYLELYVEGKLWRDDLGYFSNDSASDQTEEYTLSPYGEYMLKVTVYAPPGLLIGHKYTADVEIDAWERPTPTHPAGVSTGAIDFKATITPTLDYYVFGKVYMSDGSRAEFVDVKIKNTKTGGSTTGLTDKNGEYFVKITEMGYHEGDIIQVSAVKGDEKGSASTLVSIVPPFRQDFLGSECDVHLKKTTENIIEQVKYPLTAGIIIAVCIIGFFSAKKLREKEKEGRAEKAKRKLMKLEERRKELEKEIEKAK
jgi:hypothetical protein